MGNVADGKDLYGDASTWPPLPLKVKVTYNGQMKEIRRNLIKHNGPVLFLVSNCQLFMTQPIITLITASNTLSFN